MRSIMPLFALVLAVSGPAVATEVVPVPPFGSVELRGGGDVELRPGPVQRVTLLEGSTQFTNVRVERKRELKIDACNARCPHQYRLRVLIESPTIPSALAVQGGGTMTAASGFGPPNELTLAISGGGVIDTKAIPSDVVTAAVNGGGEIKVGSRGVLTAAVNGGGAIRYWGNPKVTTAIMGGGTVQPGR